MSLPELKFFRITGPVSVRPVTEKLPYFSGRFLIMGPTGAGKSSFIEALGGESHGLNISGDQLASVTQKVTAYEFVNVHQSGRPLYIVDTPGFSDTKISEGEIVGMVNEWRKENRGFCYKIFFFIPINATRIEGTKRRTMKMINQLLAGDLKGLIFVTTMWDQLGSERAQQRADSNYKQLENDILEEYIYYGAQLTKFENNRLSALLILDKYRFRAMRFHSWPEIFYHDLHERISTALQEKQMIEEQMTNPTNNDILELKELLEKNHTVNEDLLVKFIGQLQGYHQPPDDYEDAYAHIPAAIIALGDELESMEERARQRALAAGQQLQHEVPVLGDYRRRLEQELEVYGRRQSEQGRERVLEGRERQQEIEPKLELELHPSHTPQSVGSITGELQGAHRAEGHQDGDLEDVRASDGELGTVRRLGTNVEPGSDFERRPDMEPKGEPTIVSQLRTGRTTEGEIDVENENVSDGTQLVHKEKGGFRRRLRYVRTSIASVFKRPTSAVTRAYRSLLRRS